MSEKPILFSGPMVKAILADRKTQTRRLGPARVAPGDTMWVREACSIMDDGGHMGTVVLYRADYPDNLGIRWRPGIHMPRWASRIQLRVTRVWTEPLKSISDADVRAEGFDSLEEFARTWAAIHSYESWNSNPTVTCIEFWRWPGLDDEP